MNTPIAPHRPSRYTRAIASLEYLAPAWFALVMGWAGLSQAWLRAIDVFGDTALSLGLVAAIFAQVIFALLCLACIVRLSAHPNAVAADMRHPVRHAFMATLPISILLLASLGINLFWGTSRNLDTALTFLWCVGSVLELMTTAWVVGRWLKPADQGGLQWATFTPVFFIPVVGNVLAPLGGVSIGLESWATAQFGIGLLLWPVMLTLLFVRLAQAGQLPARLAPTWFITLVPPSIVGLSLLQMDAPLALVWLMWGIACFFLMLVLTQLRVIREQPFGLAHWGMSFPMAAFTSLTLRMSHAPQGGWLHLPSLMLLAVTSLLILGLTLNTWHGLRHGHLLVPEK
jgi:tellurite resistance protein